MWKSLYGYTYIYTRKIQIINNKHLYKKHCLLNTINSIHWSHTLTTNANPNPKLREKDGPLASIQHVTRERGGGDERAY